MKEIKIIIERSKDAFWGFAENYEGISAVGDSVKEVKSSVIENIQINIELGNLPVDFLENTKFIYKFDLESLLEYYNSIFTYSALEKLTGINQKQIQHYSTGYRNPKEETRKKIEHALHKLGEELQAVEL